MSVPASARAPIPVAPPEPPRLVSDGRARRADTTRQPHDKWTFVLIPPGTGSSPRTFHVSVRRLRAMFAAVGTVTGASVVLTAVLGMVLSGTPRLENEWKGVQLGVLAAAPPASTALPATITPPSTRLPESLATVIAAVPPPRGAGADSAAAAPRVAVRAPVAVAPSPRRVAPTVIHRPRPAEVEQVEAGIIEALPVIGRITSSFARARRHPLLGVVRRHQGIDIAAPSGTRITAPAAGRVSFAGRKVGFGLVVEIDHGGGVMTRYAHCRSLSVAAGRQVEVGQTIATVGSTGLATGPHLHYEMIVNGRSVDPMKTSLAALLPAPAPVPAPTEVVTEDAPPVVEEHGPAAVPDSTAGDSTAVAR